MSLNQACEELGIHRNTAYRLRRAGRFPIEVIVLGLADSGSKGARYYCRRTDVEDFLHARAS